MAGAGAALLVLAAFVFLRRDSPRPDAVQAASAASTSSSASGQPSSSTTSSSVGTETTSAVPSTTTTTPGLVCRNSTDPECGPFFYDWTEPNHPAQITIVASPAQPHAGETVTFTITMDDPDGAPISRCFSFGPDEAGQTTGTCADGAAPGYGPWDPPPAWQNSEFYTMTFNVAGEHRVAYSTEEGGPSDAAGIPRATAELVFNVTP